MPIYTDFKNIEKPVKSEPKAKPVKNDISAISVVHTDFSNSLATDEMRELIDIIDVKYLDNYGDWLRIIWGIHNATGDFDLCVKVSARSHKFSGEADVKKYIYNDKKNLITFGTVAHYARLSDSEKFFKIKEYYTRDVEFDDMTLAECFLDCVGDDIIFSADGSKEDAGMMYYYTEPYWEELELKNNYLLKYKINKILRSVVDTRTARLLNELLELTKKEADIEDETGKKILNHQRALINSDIQSCNKLSKSINSATRIENVCKCVMTIMSVKKADYQMNDLHPNYFCFKNTAFDVETGKEVKITKYDYISLHTGYNWSKPKEKYLKQVKDIIESIQTDPELRACMLSILKQALVGKQTDRIIYFNGGGGNGKGVILEHLEQAMGGFFTRTPSQFLCEPVKPGANTTLFNLKNRRCVVFSEPEAGKPLNTSALKQITDQPVFVGRGNYMVGEVKFSMYNTTILECNERPAMKGRADDAVKRRFIDLLFPNTFKATQQEVDELGGAERGVFLGDPTIKDKPKITKRRCAFIWYIMKNAENKLVIPAKVQSRSAEFLMNNDELLSWFKEEFQLVKGEEDLPDTKKTFMRMKEIYQHFKNGDFYTKMSSTDKREKWSYSRFKENIMSNIYLRKFYKDSHNYFCEQKQSDTKAGMCLMGWTIKSDETKQMDFI
jgi:phage/plasmid-associated DNA primase